MFYYLWSRCPPCLSQNPSLNAVNFNLGCAESYLSSNQRIPAAIVKERERKEILLICKQLKE